MKEAGPLEQPRSSQEFRSGIVPPRGMLPARSGLAVWRLRDTASGCFEQLQSALEKIRK